LLSVEALAIIHTMNLRVAMAFAALTMIGCPTYEDEHTGRYVEVLDADREACFESRLCNVVMIDFFRFGDFSQAIVREFDRGLRNTVDTPFVEESRCAWTRADRFGTNGKFNLKINQQSNDSTILRGSVADDSSELNIEFLSDSDSESLRAVRLAFDEDSPRAECSSASDYIVTAEADGSMPNAAHTIKNPVFVIVWLGLERYESPGGVVYLPTQGAPTWWRLPTSMLLKEGTALTGYINGIQVPPPDEKFLSASGETEFGLAHLVVVDDEPEETGRFSWSLADEPIVATSTALGLPTGSEWQLSRPSSGKALFFVKDSLLDLNPAIRERIVNLEGYEWMEQHFYMVDFIADGEEIIELKLPERRIGERPRMVTTDRFLESKRIELPRLFPYNAQ